MMLIYLNREILVPGLNNIMLSIAKITSYTYRITLNGGTITNPISSFSTNSFRQLQTNKIGIVGTGSLGQSLTRMLLNPGKNNIESIICSVRRSNHMEELQNSFMKDISQSILRFTLNNTEVVQKSNCVLLSVKPSQIKTVCDEIGENISPDVKIISVAAAVPLSKLHDWLPRTETIIRCMPNIPCSIGQGVVPYISRDKSPETHDIMTKLFYPNILLPLNNDAEIDASTLISGCGPAFLAWYIDCLNRISVGTISPDNFNIMMTQTMIGTAHMLQNISTGDIIRTVASPNGATEATLHNFHRKGIDNIIHESLFSAQTRINSIIDTLN